MQIERRKLALLDFLHNSFYNSFFCNSNLPLYLLVYLVHNMNPDLLLDGIDASVQTVVYLIM